MNPILLSETESNRRPQICLLHMDEVAKRLGVSLQRAHELGRQGLLPIVRLGRQMRVEEHIYQATKGIPRKVNKLAVAGLRLAAQRHEATVDNAIVLDATQLVLL